ncbi:MAG: MATE family efflux transporter [Chlorobi bacterium]|nr:MATE family efflux transporter [Chlorobiota bacterium]
MKIFSGYKQYYTTNLKLAIPLIISQAGQVVVSLVDNIMVGRVGTAALAASSFANNIFIIILVFGIGFSFATTPVVGKAMGSGDVRNAVIWFHHGFRVNMFMGVLLVLFAFVVSLFMPYMGQPEDVVELGVPYFLVISVSIIPFLYFATFKQFAEGLSNTRIAMVITVAGNLVNIVFNYLFIFGKAGFPEMGLLGAGIGTLTARVFMAVAFAVAYRKLVLFERFRKIHSDIKFSLGKAVQLMRLGAPIGIQFIIEVFAFSMGGIMMGWLGEKSLAAHQIVLTMASLTYMMSSGLASATTIRVSTLRGQGRMDALKYSAFASIHIVILFMLFTALLFVVLRNYIPLIFISDAEVINIAAGLFVIVAFFQVFDGLQVVVVGILRGMEDVVFPMVVIGVAYLLVAIPAGYIMSFVYELGPAGIWYGYLSGLAIVGLVLLFRFRKLHLRYAMTQT